MKIPLVPPAPPGQKKKKSVLPKPVDHREIEKFNTTLRIYPDGQLVFRFLVSDHYAGGSAKRISDGLCSDDRIQAISCSRAKLQIFDLARANHWDYFITLTLNQEVVDRYSYGDILPKMQSFTKYLRRHGCQWLIVPELHQDGAFHFHGLVAGPLPVEWWRFERLESGERVDIYKISGYALGRNEATKVIDPSRVSTYMTKYVTKQLLQTVPPGKKRFWASRGLSKPQKERLHLSDDEVQSLIHEAQYTATYADPSGNDIVTVMM